MGLLASERGRVALVLTAVAVTAAPFLPSYYLHILTLMVIFALFALSLDILMGYGGLPSLGHAASFGAAGYTIGLLIVRYDVNWVVGLIVALAVGTLVAAIFGLVAIRAVDVFFMMITLALCQILWGIANRWSSFTGGYNGLPGIPRPIRALDSTLVFFYVSIVLLWVIGLLVSRFVSSPFGLALQAIRDRELRMSVLGYNVWAHKYLTFVICGGLAAVAGILNAVYNGFVSPVDLSIRMSAEAILMVVMGGTGTLIGPVIGAAMIVGLRNVLSVYTERWPIVLGTIFMLTVMFAPNGILGRFRGRGESAAGRLVPQADRGHVRSGTAHHSVMSVRERLLAHAPEVRGPRESPALELLGVSKAFGGLSAVKDVSFSIRSGERVAVLGPNGAGKTTLFNLISGTMDLSSGRVLLFGEDITTLPAHKRTAKGLARTFQITTLFPTLTVLDHVQLALLAVDRSKFFMLRPVDGLEDVTGAARSLLEGFDLWGRRHVPVRELSHGEQRQLETLLAIASSPRVLLLDEPTSGVAAAEVASIVAAVKALGSQIAVLIIEHDIDVAFKLADRILVLHYGELLRDGTPSEVKEDPLVQEIYLGGV